ncbi:7-cyano-7-deazaguanine synthase QueC [Myxococcota bacterium]|nr:7-cyano-7-deazaguanine synthase QueC [Myxococcota bacterium]
MTQERKKAVVLLSGGLDSTTTLAIAQSQGYELYTLSMDYGQRLAVELKAAEKVIQHYGVKEHKVGHIDLQLFGGSALTADIDVPKDRDESHMADGKIPITYVPARNTIFLSYALGWAEVLGAFDIFIGVNAVDYSGYPDCRPEYVEAFEKLANLATGAAVEGKGVFKIQTPLMHLKKSEIIQQGIELGVDYGLTLSCYDPIGELACGRCDSCILRAQGFADAGVPDPTPYAPIKDSKQDSK